MGQRGRISFSPDGKLLELLDARRERMISETGVNLSRSALIRMMLRQSLGESAHEVALMEAHFRLADVIRQAIGKLSHEMQDRIVELVEEELKTEAEG